MPRYLYRALSASGDLVAGELVGADAAAIIEQLHESALVPIEAVEQRARRAGLPDFRRQRRTRLRAGDLAILMGQLARLLKAGLPLDRALEILAELAGDTASGTAMRRTLARVRDGASLAEAMAAQEKAFPADCVSTIRAGEEGGALQPVVARLADFLGRREANRQKIASALLYPAVLIVVAGLSIGLVLTVVLPQFAPLFAEAGTHLPAMTRLVMTAGDWLREGWWALLLAAVAGAFGWRELMRRPAIATRRDRLLLALPLAGELVRKYQFARFARTLGALLSNGVAAPRALALAGAAMTNRVVAAAVETVAVRLKEGEGLSAPLARAGEFPDLAIQLIRIGEETGRLEEMLSETAEIYDQEVDQALQRLIALLVPAITVAMGMVIGLMIAAVMMAMISINDLAM